MFEWCASCCFFFFFKQKTAYEMRISDWSSDVCSSDLGQGAHVVGSHVGAGEDRDDAGRLLGCGLVDALDPGVGVRRAHKISVDLPGAVDVVGEAALAGEKAEIFLALDAGADPRSEEHTSELQSLMRISYAVFCLKKQHKTKIRN